MKYLLVAVNAKYIHSNLAVYSLKTYGEKYGLSRGRDNVEIEIAEYTINQYKEEIIRDIYMRKPDIIGFSCYIWNIVLIKDVIKDFKKICPNVKIWVGGPEVSYNMEQVLRDNGSIDYVMYGEGEKIFKEVIEAYSRNSLEESLSDIKGLAYRQDGNIIINSPMPLIDMSSIPFTYNDMKEFENKIIYYETSRGCPFSCSYCLSSVEKKLRFRDIDIVKKELKFI